MSIANAFAFLTPPGKGASGSAAISGKELVIGPDKLSTMLAGIFSSNPSPRDFDITFNRSLAGKPENVCRSLLIAFNAKPDFSSALEIAKRLYSVTDNRSGLGLLFILSGTLALKQRVVVSRFPTDEAILAEVASSGLAVEFLEQVFIKRLSSYKAVMLEHENPGNGFWSGVATDRQAGQSGEHISEYWLKDFLDADFSETPAAGTKRLANALKSAQKSSSSLAVKTQIAHASSLAASTFKGKALSIEGFCDHFGFDEDTRNAIKNQLSKPSLFSKPFKFDTTEFKAIVSYRTIELDTGALLTAPNDDFESIFETEDLPGKKVRYFTEGAVRDQRLSRK